MTYGKAASEPTSIAPTIFKFSPIERKSIGAKKHRKFESFVAKIEADTQKSAELKATRSRLAKDLYSNDEVTLKVLRMRAGFTQTQLAKLLETSQPHVARLEAGRQDPNLTTLKKLSQVLGLPISDVIAAIDVQAEINESETDK